MTERPNPYDQVGTVDTSGVGSTKIPDIETAIPAVPPEEGEEVPEGTPDNLAAQKAMEEEVAEGDGEQSEVPAEEAPEEVAPEEEGSAEEAGEQSESSYDPAEHTVAEVLEYLTANPQEREAVLQAERDGKARKGILESLEEEG